jgi:hypothetical protein
LIREFRVQRSEFRVQRSEFSVQSSGFWSLVRRRTRNQNPETLNPEL